MSIVSRLAGRASDIRITDHQATELPVRAQGMDYRVGDLARQYYASLSARARAIPEMVSSLIAGLPDAAARVAVRAREAGAQVGAKVAPTVAGLTTARPAQARRPGGPVGAGPGGAG